MNPQILALPAPLPIADDIEKEAYSLSTVVPAAHLALHCGVIRVSLETISIDGETRGQSTIVTVDYAADDWEDGARAALEDCIRKEHESHLRIFSEEEEP